MIKIQQFPVADYKKANEFMAKNPPMGKEGIILHQGSICIFYEEGEVYTTAERIVFLKGELGDKRAQLQSAELDVAFWKAEEEFFSPKGKNNRKERVEAATNQRLIAEEDVRMKEGRIALIVADLIALGCKEY